MTSFFPFSLSHLFLVALIIVSPSRKYSAFRNSSLNDKILEDYFHSLAMHSLVILTVGLLS
jgi:hypothetical protein